MVDGDISLKHSEFKADAERTKAESLSFISAEPSRVTKASGKVASFVGDKIVRIIPTHHLTYAMGQLSEKLEGWHQEKLPSQRNEHAFKPSQVSLVIKKADRVHTAGLLAVFAEGFASAGASTVAALGGPSATLATALVEAPLNYSLLLAISFQIQKAFYLRPTIDRASRAFNVAVAVSSEERRNAWAGVDPNSMYEAVLTRKLIAQHGRMVASNQAIKRSARSGLSQSGQLLGSTLGQSASREVVDTGADEGARLALVAGYTAFLRNHPRFMSVVLPVAGAIAGGTWSVYMARSMMLANYHVSRLDYLERVVW